MSEELAPPRVHAILDHLEWHSHEEQSGQFLNENPPHPGRHFVSGWHAVVNIENDGRQTHGQSHQYSAEHQIPAIKEKVLQFPMGPTSRLTLKNLDKQARRVSSPV